MSRSFLTFRTKRWIQTEVRQLLGLDEVHDQTQIYSRNIDVRCLEIASYPHPNLAANKHLIHWPYRNNVAYQYIPPLRQTNCSIISLGLMDVS